MGFSGAWKLKRFALAALGVAVIGGAAQSAQAQCKDKWVTDAVTAVRAELKLPGGVKGSGNSGECSIDRYGGGSWSSYDDLVQKARMSFVCDDPWIGQAVGELDRYFAVNTGGGPGALSRVKVVGAGKSGECNPKLYGNWTSYADLKTKVKANWDNHQVGQCRDPFITSAIVDAKRRLGLADTSVQAWGELGECNMYLYGGGNWSNQQDLTEKVYQTFKAVKKMDMHISFAGFYHNASNRIIPFNSLLIVNGNNEVLSRPDPAIIAASTVLTQAAKDKLLGGATNLTDVRLIGNDGGSYIGPNGASIVGNAGGNMVAAGGGNILGGMGGQIVAAGGGNIVAAGAGN